jgi:hypothetical protein
MGLFVVINSKKSGQTEYGQLATVQGWTDFSDWALLQKCVELTRLIHDGVALNMVDLADEIEFAIKASKPHKDVQSIGKDIVTIARRNPEAYRLLVTDGSSDDDELDEEDPDDIEDYEDQDFEDDAPIDDDPPAPKSKLPKPKPIKPVAEKPAKAKKPPKKSK